MKTMTIKELSTNLVEEMSYQAVGNLFGVSRLQVRNYVLGKSSNPKPRVCLNILDNVVIDGEQVLVGPYKDEQHLRDTVKMLDLAGV